MTPSPRERLIGATIGLVRERGVAGTGITDLLARSNTARRSVYNIFPGGKAQLVVESTRVAGTMTTNVIAELTASDDPLQSLTSFVTIWKNTLVASDFTAGCPIVAAAMAGAEASAAPEAAAEAFAAWEAAIASQLGRCGVEVKTAHSLAMLALSAIEGAVVLSIASRSVRPLDDTELHLAELVQLHLGTGGMSSSKG